MQRKNIPLEKNQLRVKDLFNGEVVNINQHDYFYKGPQDVSEGGIRKKMLGFWSVKTDLKRYFDLKLLEHIVTKKGNTREEGFNW